MGSQTGSMNLLSVIVPCFNEFDNVKKLHHELLPVIEELVNHGWNENGDKIDSAEIIFVDDGSRDGTSNKLREVFDNENPSKVEFIFLKHKTNQGLGAALRTGFNQAQGDLIVTVDSDGTYKFTGIPALLSCLKPGVDIVTASPYHPKGEVIGIPAYRLILSRGSSLIYRLLVDWHIHTYTCLFRAYRPGVIKNIAFKSNGFLGGTELLVKALLKGYKADEVPEKLYRRQYGESKARIVQTILSHLKFQSWVLRLRLGTLLGKKSTWMSKKKL